MAESTVQPIVLAAASAGVFWLVSIYASGLRDPRYLDGWLLVGGMSFQIGFHIALKTSRLSPRSASAMRKLHVFAGYLLIAAFISHSDFSWPDTGFEWALWTCFVFVTLSGISGTYLAWSQKNKRGAGDPISTERIVVRRSELARDVRAVLTAADPQAFLLPLPAPPDDAWMMDLYNTHLRNYFQGPRNSFAHTIGSERPLKRLVDEIDNLTRYVDPQAKDKLSAIKAMVIEKDQLDAAHVHHALTKAWLFVHVPVTYALIVLTGLHILVVYAFSSGNW